MKLADALNKFGPVRGVTSMIAGLMSGDAAPISGGKHVGESLAEARRHLEKNKQAQRDCKSEWAYWGYQGDISYWTAVVALLEAAELVGSGNLPDVPYDDSGGVVMDVCARQERFGETVLLEARRRAKEADAHV